MSGIASLSNVLTEDKASFLFPCSLLGLNLQASPSIDLYHTDRPPPHVPIEVTIPVAESPKGDPSLCYCDNNYIGYIYMRPSASINAYLIELLYNYDASVDSVTESWY